MVRQGNPKRYKKIRLLETSCVGIQAYPDAHMSAGQFNLIKALQGATNTQLNKIKEKMEKEETTPTEEVETPEETSEETPEEEAKKDETPEAEAETEEESEEEVLSAAKIEEIVGKAVEANLKKLLKEGGEVETEEEEETEEEKIKSMSNGELTSQMMSMNLFGNK